MSISYKMGVLSVNRVFQRLEKAPASQALSFLPSWMVQVSIAGYSFLVSKNLGDFKPFLIYVL